MGGEKGGPAGLPGTLAVLARALRERSFAPVEVARAVLERVEDEGAGRLSILGGRPRVEVTAGDAAATLRELAGRGEAATLVAVGRRDTGSAEGFALGSFPTSTLRASGGPVLVVPSPGEARR